MRLGTQQYKVFISGTTRSQHSDTENRRTKREVNYEEMEEAPAPPAAQDDSQLLSEALLSAAAAGHRVRNIREKIEDIGENSQLGMRGRAVASSE